MKKFIHCLPLSLSVRCTSGVRSTINACMYSSVQDGLITSMGGPGAAMQTQTVEIEKKETRLGLKQAAVDGERAETYPIFIIIHQNFAVVAESKSAKRW